MSDEDFIANISDSDSDNDFLGFASIDVPIHNKKKKKKKKYKQLIWRLTKVPEKGQICVKK